MDLTNVQGQNTTSVVLVLLILALGHFSKIIIFFNSGFVVFAGIFAR